MALTLVHGPNLSGRSEALRDFAWDHGPTSGVYLHPNPMANFSGLARTVAGEAEFHRINLEGGTLAAGLRGDQRLATLSGGQQVRLILAGAVSGRPHRLSIDTLLEQLDPANRRHAVERLRADGMDCRLSDNAPEDLWRTVDEVEVRPAAAEGGDLNARLAEFAGSIGSEDVRAPRIAVDRLGLSYGGTRVFRRASYEFEPGRPHLLKAPNGAGKSSLARILVGAVRPDAGSVVVDGGRHAAWRSDRNVLACAFQNPFDQILGHSVRSYLNAISVAADKREGSLAQRPWNQPRRVLDAIGLAPWADREPFDLPPFIAKRLTIASALVARSPWMFFDEPGLWSDPAGRAALGDLFNALARIGCGVVIVSHQDEFDSLDNAVGLTIAEGRLEEGGPS